MLGASGCLGRVDLEASVWNHSGSRQEGTVDIRFVTTGGDGLNLTKRFALEDGQRLMVFSDDGVPWSSRDLRGEGDLEIAVHLENGTFQQVRPDWRVGHSQNNWGIILSKDNVWISGKFAD